MSKVPKEDQCVCARDAAAGAKASGTVTVVGEASGTSAGDAGDAGDVTLVQGSRS